MITKIPNPCPRCGRERIEVRTWIEEVATFFGTNEVTHIATACPDRACQEIVNQKNEAVRQKKEQMQRDKDRRIKKAHEAKKRQINFSGKKRYNKNNVQSFPTSPVGFKRKNPVTAFIGQRKV